MDEYTTKVFQFLEKATPGQSFTIEKICKAETRERFIEAVKLWIRSFPYGGGVTFNDDYTKIKIIGLPDLEKSKPINNGKQGRIPEAPRVQ